MVLSGCPKKICGPKLRLPQRGSLAKATFWLSRQPSALELGHGGDSGQLLDGGVDPGLGELDVLELAREVGVVRRHVEVAVTRKAKQDGSRLPSFSRGCRFLNHGPNGVG